MAAKIDKIRERIAALEAELKAQQERDRAARKRRIGRAAERAGLLKIDIDPAVLEKAMRELAEAHGVGDAGENGPDSANAGGEDQAENDSAEQKSAGGIRFGFGGA